MDNITIGENTMETTQSTKQVFFDVTCYVEGIKKKCRRNARHSIKLNRIAYDANYTLDNDTKNLAITKIKEIMKSYGPQAKLCFNRVEVDEHFVSFLMFDERHKTFNLELN